MNGAKDWIYVTNFAFWVGKNLVTKFSPTFNFENPPQGQKIDVKTIGEQLQEIMKTKAAGNVPVKIVLNNIRWPVPYIELLLFLIFVPLFILSPGLLRGLLVILDLLLIRFSPDDPDSIDEVNEYFKRSKVAIREFSGQLWFGFLHAKLVSIDGQTAFIMGSSLSQGYFNDRRHLIHDARHNGSLTHDVNLKLTGPAVEHVERTFGALWNKLSPDSKIIPLDRQSQPGGIGVQVLRTLPGDTFSIADSGEFNATYQYGETSVLEAYQRAIVNAKDYVYIEDQYFTAPEIVTALIERMNSPDGSNLQVIVVLNPDPDIPGYPKKQFELIRQLRNGVPGHENRVGVFTLWSFDETKPPYNKAKEPHELLSIYVHSKVAIVDDVWTTVGSANVDGASLNESQIGTILGGAPYFGRIPLLPKLTEALLALFSSSVLESGKTARSTQHANPQQSSQPPRQTELNLVVYNDIAGQPKTDAVIKLREQLFREHLGFLPTSAQASSFPSAKPADGWLPLWKRIAKEKRDAINARQKHPATILEWQHESDLKKYLKASGIDTSKPTRISVREPGKAHQFDWDTGKWKKKD
jgi:phosphatidylserine/phosphatidylglycerophosphate/cardiolipin synthase-like enzyme